MIEIPTFGLLFQNFEPYFIPTFSMEGSWKPVYSKYTGFTVILWYNFQAIKDFKSKSKDGIDSTTESQLDTSGVENKENTKEGTNTNSFIAYTPVTEGAIPGLDLVNESEQRTEKSDKVNGTTDVNESVANVTEEDKKDVPDVDVSENNVNSNTETAMDTTDSVQNKPSEIVNGDDDGFGNFDHINENEVTKEGESEMDTTENDTELDNTLSPSEPQISSADNVTVTDEGDSVEDNLDDRLASLAKASDLLHSIAQAAAEESENYPTVVDFKEDADDVLENEVSFLKGSDILPGEESLSKLYMFCLPFEKGSTLKGKNLLPVSREQILSLLSRPIFGRDLVCMNAGCHKSCLSPL